MAHDVWLLRRTLITFLLLSVFAGTAKGTNKTLLTHKVPLSDIKPPASETFPSQTQHAVHNLIKNGLSKVHHKVKQRIADTHHKSAITHAHARPKSTRSKKSHENQATKRTVVEGSEVTGANRTRMHVLDSFFVHPETLKEALPEENNFAKNRESFHLALSLDGFYARKPNAEMSSQNEEPSELRTIQDLDQEVSAHFLDWSRKGFGNEELRTDENEVGGLHMHTKSPNFEEYSVEGRKIVNAASLVESSLASQGTGLTESVTYPGEKVGNRAGAFQYFLPTNNAMKFKQRSRYRFVSSLIKPQLAGISDDLTGLDAQRNRAKSVNLKVLKDDFKFREFKPDIPFSEDKDSKGEKAGENLTEHKDSEGEQAIDGSNDNTEGKAQPQYNADDMFLLGAPDHSTYLQDVFLANPHPINTFSGSGDGKVAHNKYKEHPTLPWQKLTTTVKTGSQSKISNVTLEKLRESGLHESINSTKKPRPPSYLQKYRDKPAANQGKSLRVQESIYSGKEWDSTDSGLNLDTRVDDNLQLALETDRKLKPTSRVSLQSFKDEAMLHTGEEGSSVIYSSGHGNVDTQRGSPSSHFRPTRVRGFPTVTTVSSYKKTTISHGGFNSDYEFSTSGSGEESGSGEDVAFLHKQYRKLQPTERPSSQTKKTHTGILGITDKETKTKCEKMGKSDYREKCPHGWLSFDEFCYLFVLHSKGKWEEFPPKCNEENALPAMPKTDKELAFLQDNIPSPKSKTKYFYIGLKKKSGAWTWIDDTPYTREVHVTDKLGTKNCGALSKRGEIHMVTCNEPKAGYVCELRTGVKALSILAVGDSLTNGFNNDDKSHTPYAKTLEYLLNKDIHKCYTLTTVAKDGVEASEISAQLQTHLKNAKLKYSWVIILAGTNDIVHNSHTRKRRAWNTAVEHIIDLHIMSHRFGAKTMAVTIPEMDCEESDKPACQHTRLERKYINEKLRHYARTNDFTILCDLATKFPRYSLNSEERKQLWEEDLHMKPAGYERMAEIIYKDLLAHVDDEDNLS